MYVYTLTYTLQTSCKESFFIFLSIQFHSACLRDKLLRKIFTKSCSSHLPRVRSPKHTRTIKIMACLFCAKNFSLPDFFPPNYHHSRTSHHRCRRYPARSQPRDIMYTYICTHIRTISYTLRTMCSELFKRLHTHTERQLCKTSVAFDDFQTEGRRRRLRRVRSRTVVPLVPSTPNHPPLPPIPGAYK